MANRIGRLISAVFIGTLSGFALYLIPAMLMDSRSISQGFVASMFIGGLILTAWFVSRDTPSVRAVWSRGCLVLGVECVLASVVPFYAPWLALAESGMLEPGPGISQLRDAMMWEAKLYSIAGIGICLMLGAGLFFLSARTKEPTESRERHV